MLKYVFLIALVGCFFTPAGYAQTKRIEKSPAAVEPVKPVEKKYSALSAKAGVNISVIFLARNIKDNNNSPGYCGGLVYELNDFVRISGLYTRFNPINIEPTWLNVKASTVEANLELLAKFPNRKTLLYPFVGISYNTFTGFFTGKSDFLNLKEYYDVNTTVKNRWLGVNLGTGLEHNFGILGLFVDYRMRVGKQDKVINIMDVCYTAGLKVRLPATKSNDGSSKTPSNKKKRFRLSNIFSNTGKRYKL